MVRETLNGWTLENYGAGAWSGAIGGAGGTLLNHGSLSGTATLNATLQNNGTLHPGGHGTTGASVGDFVWMDMNHNGIQDPGEMGVGGIQVNLLDQYGAVLASTMTDYTGHWLFTGLAAGSYRVQFLAASSYAFTAQGQGTDGA